MKITKDGPQSIGQIARHFEHGNLFLSPEEYQRESAWGMEQKQRLIDTVFRRLDIPKFYLWKVDQRTLSSGYPEGETKELYKALLDRRRKENDDPDPYIFEVVDGQQRIRTILEYMGQKPPNDRLYRGPWRPPFNALDETPVAKGRGYEKLNPDQQNQFDQYSLSIMVLEDAKIPEIRDMFLRLQSGTPLKAQQERDATGSDVGTNARLLSELPFFINGVAFSGEDGNHRRLASQMLLLEYRDKIAKCTSQSLDRFYEDHVANRLDRGVVSRAKAIVDTLGKIFPAKCPHLNRSYALSLYWALSRILQSYTISGAELPKIKENFEKLNIGRIEASQRDYSAKPGDDVFEELSLTMSYGTDGLDKLAARHDILTKFVFAGVTLTSLPALDPKRAFTHEEKLILSHAAGGRCQLSCDGNACGRAVLFDDAAIDHIIPHSRGGKSELCNGRYAHKLCNIARGARDGFDPSKQCCLLSGQSPGDAT